MLDAVYQEQYYSKSTTGIYNESTAPNLSKMPTAVQKRVLLVLIVSLVPECVVHH